MRMWLVDPKLLCRRHLLGEHVEMHMAAGYVAHGHSLKPWTDRGFMDPRQINSRHDALAAEMERRGYKHNSPLAAVSGAGTSTVHVDANLRELAERCVECRGRIRGND